MSVYTALQYLVAYAPGTFEGNDTDTKTLLEELEQDTERAAEMAKLYEVSNCYPDTGHYPAVVWALVYR